MATHYHNYDNSTHYPNTIQINEHKAPTDQSIKLLNEFEEKARNNIIAKVNVTDNTINGVAIMYTDNQCSASAEGIIHYKFSINGKEYLIKDTFNFYEIEDKKEYELQKYLNDKMKGKVANAIIYELSKIALEQLKNK